MPITTERYNMMQYYTPVGSSGQPIPGPGGISGKDLKKEQERYLEAISRTAPVELLKAFRQIAQEGLMSESELVGLMQIANRSDAFRRAALSRGLKQKLGARLGPRSGAVDTMIANKVYAPSFADATNREVQLRAGNYASRLSGLQGYQDTTQMIMQMLADKENKKKTGAVDWAGALGTVAQGAGALIGAI